MLSIKGDAMTTRTPLVRKRRKQSDRSDDMRERLLTATLDVVREDGWARASTPRICERAGVSRGAQTHHFPAKIDLLLAAVRQIVETYQSEIDDELVLKAGRSWSLRRLFKLLWSACLEDGLMECWVEVMVAARTERDMRGAVAELDNVSLASMRLAGRSASAHKTDVAADIVELTVYLLRGMVLQRGVHPDERERRRLFDLWVRIVADHLGR
jgi:AcrR family transcriptional regulator